MKLLVNKHAQRNYEILKTYSAGIKLSGQEVKSLRQQHGSLKEAYIKMQQELFLVNCHIPPFQGGHADMQSYDPYQARKLLLTKKEIQDIASQTHEKGLTIIPLSIYTKGDYIKIDIATARGKKLYDKRNDLKERSMKRDTDRIIKNHT